MSRKSLFAFLVLAALSPACADVQPQNYYGKIAKRLGDMMPRYHVLRQRFDDRISQQAWTNLVTFYDFDHSVFLQSDLDELSRHRLTLDDEFRNADVSFAFKVHNLYCRRLGERIGFATNLLGRAEWDFSTDEVFRVKRKDAPWPATRIEAENHWRMKLKNEILVQILNAELDKSTNKVDAAGNLIKKYRQYHAVLSEPDEETVLQRYLSAVAQAYDPHSDYLSPTSKEDFDMEMNLTLCGVGAVLQLDEGALKIVEVMSGGPMAVDGRIKEGDKIVGVQQGDGEMEDVMWKPMKKTIKKIRGRKGTRVTLEIVPRSDSSGGSRKRIELVRDEIKLEDQAATGRVERVTLDGVERNLGYVYLPTFYGTMDKRPHEAGFRSCSADVARYLADFNAQGVDGLVLDLRGNGGGSLREAALLSALFVQQGPVVQISDNRSVGSIPIPPGNPVAFRKPMTVLIDRASASASEIVAGHLRDTGRAIVLGDRCSHGKGTVQTVLGMGPERYGSAKITTARFYRVNGRSTQLEGVASDIHLPSLLDSLDIGEDKLPNAMPFSRIAQAPGFVRCWDLDGYIPELKRLSAARLAECERYQKHLRNVEGMKLIGEREEVPLEREARKAMMARDRTFTEIDDEDDGGEDDGNVQKRRRKRNERAEDDVVLDAAFDILHDLIRLNGGKELPKLRETNEWFNSILGGF